MKGDEMVTGSKTKGRSLDREAMPTWKTNSVDRSLTTARQRAQERTDRFVNAAMELMNERGTTEFTVQEIIDRARMSIRTFYKFFASKDDLLVAVHETIMTTEVVPRLHRQCEKESDPLGRIRAYIEGIYELTANPRPASRALSTFRSRLAETRPADLEHSMRPQLDMVVDLVRSAIDSGRLQTSLTPDAAGLLLHHTVLAAVHARVLGGTAPSAADLWQFSAAGIGVAHDDPELG